MKKKILFSLILSIFLFLFVSCGFSFDNSNNDVESNSNDSGTNIGEAEILNTPQGLKFLDNLLVWSSVEHADYYVLNINEVEYSSSQNKFELTFADTGKYTAKVKAKTNDDKYKESYYSMPIVFEYVGSSSNINNSENAVDINKLSRQLLETKKEYPQESNINKQVININQDELSKYDEINQMIENQLPGYNYNYKKVKSSASFDDITTFGINEDTFYPGALIALGNGLTENHDIIRPLLVNRSPYSLWMNNYTSTGGNFHISNIQNPNASTVYKGVYDVVNNNLSTDTLMPYQISSKITNVTSEYDLSVALNCEISSIPANLKASFDFSSSSSKSYSVLMIKQLYYTIYTDPLLHAADYFDEKVTAKDIANKLRTNEIPAYISGIQYGRIIMVTIETNKSDYDISSLINASGKYGPISADVAADYINKLNSSQMKCNYFIYGGSPISNQGIFETTNINRILSILTESCSAKNMVGKPITYLIRYLDGDLAKISSTAEYFTSTKTPKQLKEISTHSFDGNTQYINSANLNYFKNKEYNLIISSFGDYGQHYIDPYKNNFDIKFLDDDGNVIETSYITYKFSKLSTDINSGESKYEIKILLKNSTLGYAKLVVDCLGVSYSFDLLIDNVNDNGISKATLLTVNDILNRHHNIKYLIVEADSNQLSQLTNKGVTITIPNYIDDFAIISSTNELFRNVNFIITSRNKKLNIHFTNFKFKAQNEKIAIDSSQVNSNLITFIINGNCEIHGGDGLNGTKGEDKNYYYDNDNHLNNDGQNGSNGTNGQVAIKISTLTTKGNGTLNIVGGNGGNGGNGGIGGTRWILKYKWYEVSENYGSTWKNKGKSWNGGNGGNGSTAADINYFVSSEDLLVKFIGGNGGSNGTGGKGGCGIAYQCKVLRDNPWPSKDTIDYTRYYVKPGENGLSGVTGKKGCLDNLNVQGNKIEGNDGKFIETNKKNIYEYYEAEARAYFSFGAKVEWIKELTLVNKYEV